ncbi:MAG: Phosphoenolpyruvate synthase [Candidatus Gottesmanbacteria bacterium GW2011_GWC2_39_8]|uniref:Phosphoenolpyruvate synthase n=1 Tax=Candidatus Gottesmanbacteria bacterium GW2011_GWC2_39_8 TaxID=1618450 RepID=A0A0G0T0H4_9BACT|nr:MAG: Phosphoenolpyruvate synthase [Candidatus Gottesmanbacteria bacterium GW2011_GWC2_39_8]
MGTVGGKGANLGEMTSFGIPVPPGFIVTAEAYFDFLEKARLKKRIEDLLDGVNFNDPSSLQRISKTIKDEILRAAIPDDISQEIISSYFQLQKHVKDKSRGLYSLFSKLHHSVKQPMVAVRSSATAEDLPQASFAGQQVTFLNVVGEATLVSKVRECWASLFEPRAIFYRHDQNFDHFRVGIAVPVQLMVESETSGIMFTLDPVNSDKSKIFVEAIYGLGELIVQGAITPDHYEVDKKNMSITVKNIVKQEKMLTKRGTETKEYSVPKEIGGKQKISDDTILKIAALGEKLEKHYFFPQDVEWAIEAGNIFIVQTRPVTTIKESFKASKTQSSKEEKNNEKKLLVKGSPASPGIATGKVRIIKSAKEIGKVKSGDVLVTEQTNPDFVPAMRKAVAIVTERGGRTSHAAIVSRELGIPAVVGAEGALKVLKTDEIITVNGGSGEVFKGGIINKVQSLKFKVQSFKEKKEKIVTATKVYVNMAQADRVVEISGMDVDGVGLLRAEFMVAGIGVHPKKLLEEGKSEVFIDKMAVNLLKFCKAFNPRPVVYRATDFKTNEYRNLAGGKRYEPEESNPMLGYRGCYRYIADPKVFEMEMEAIKRVRNKYGFKNLHLMLPFVRTVNELVEVKKILSGQGLLRSPSFKLWMMVEIPSNVILIDKFLEVGIDGVSIGSNDLTMLTLGTDRDNNEVAKEFDERNEAVLWSLERVVKTCAKYNVTSSICGQAASDYPDLVEKLIGFGITSISVNPDAVERTRQSVAFAEKRLVSKK